MAHALHGNKLLSVRQKSLEKASFEYVAAGFCAFCRQ
jgi:hypothetical protein